MQRTISNILIALNALLLFFLIFGNIMVMPAWIQSIGRMHPLLLHLPIGAVIIAVLFSFLKKDPTWLWAIAAVAAALTAIMGIILSKEGGYDENSLAIHKYSGALLSFILAGAYFFPAQKLISVFSLIVLLVAGHFGSILTHGSDFVFEPLLSKEQNKKVVSDSTSLFAASIQPMLDAKCASCHNEKKRKGDLVLSTLAGIAAGGEHGVVWKAGSPQASLLMKRILLPEGHEDHMPPQGKEQLTAPEVQLLFQWILSGADTAKAWTQFDPSDSVRKLAEQFINRSAVSTQHYTFDHASPGTIEKLNDPYRTVAPVALDEPALSATFFIRNEFRPGRLEELLSVKEQLVALNLSKMPVTDAECETIRKFEHLEKLNLNFSSITAKGLAAIASLPNLRSLSLSGTTLDVESLQILKDSKKLKEVFIWNTPVVASNIQQLPSNIQWNTGFVPDASERLRLTPPIPAADKTLLDVGETVSLTHKLPGTVIRYTTDGSDPDSTSAKIYDTPITINGYTTIKARACKDGWLCSRVGTYVLYTKGATPLETKLFTQANKDYRGEGAATLTNNKKGYVDDHRDIAWIGFRENPLSAEFKFTPGTNVRDITFSYDHNIGAWLFPPAKLEVWGGKDAEHLQLIKQLRPEQPTKDEPRHNAALVIPMETNFEVYKIVAWPLPELPKWHYANNPKTKDKRAWLFVDEVIFSR